MEKKINILVFIIYNYAFDIYVLLTKFEEDLKISLFQIMTKTKYYYFIEFKYFEIYFISYQNAYLCGSKV